MILLKNGPWLLGGSSTFTPGPGAATGDTAGRGRTAFTSAVQVMTVVTCGVGGGGGDCGAQAGGGGRWAGG